MGTVAGTTSAYAENTGSRPSASANLRNYLRVRGEYITRVAWSCTASELPPRTRRIPSLGGVFSALGGTTSAYAENTIQWIKEHLERRNYLRVRGEYVASGGLTKGAMELPPRTRRILGRGRGEH